MKDLLPRRIRLLAEAGIILTSFVAIVGLALLANDEVHPAGPFVLIIGGGWALGRVLRATYDALLELHEEHPS